jgi:hypothetical protein
VARLLGHLWPPSRTRVTLRPRLRPLPSRWGSPASSRWEPASTS